MGIMKPKFGYIYALFVISLIVLVILSFLFYQRFTSLRKYSKGIDDNYQIVLNLQNVHENTRELETAALGFFLTDEPVFLDSFETSKKSAVRSMEILKALFRKNHKEEDTLRHLSALLDKRLMVLDRNIKKARVKDSTGLKESLIGSRDLMQEFRTNIYQIIQSETRQGQDDFEKKQFYENITPNYFVIILIFSVTITLVSFYFIQREMRIRLKYQVELEKRLNELDRSSEELEQFTYVASHDLQEPLRKIRTFSDRLLITHQGSPEEELPLILKRINVSARRMQELIQDMVNFTNIVNRDESRVSVNLNYIIEKVLEELAITHPVMQPIIYRDSIPLFYGYPSQLFILFRAVLDNAIKFAKPGQHPVIKISYSSVEGKHLNGRGTKNSTKFYHRVTVEDKGIGFDEEFAEKIFIIFQRLHTQESDYKGKGIGLAIARRIMVNHNGYITAKGRLGDGASLMMYFPQEED